MHCLEQCLSLFDHLQVETDAFGNVEEHHDSLVNDNDDAATTSAPSVPESSSESSEPSGSCSGPEEESSNPRSPPELERVTDMEVEVLPPTRRHPSQWTVSRGCRINSTFLMFIKL